MNSGLSSAWQAWYEMWEAKTYAMSRLREVGNKLRAPEVSVAYNLWAGAWRVTKQRQAEEAARKADGALYQQHTRYQLLENTLAEVCA